MAEGIYDVAIIGGGLAGLSLAIQSSHAGHRTLLVEKEKYPFHKVCGEYISLESWNFLERLGVPLQDFKLPIINQLIVSAPNGKMLTALLPLGGFGISRYLLDSTMAKIARNAGVAVIENCKVDDVKQTNGGFELHFGKEIVFAKVSAGCFGKRSNLDVKWKRKFIAEKNAELSNYVGIKYHVDIDWPDDTIALHNFENGYCGISRIEGNCCCLCYMTTSDMLKNESNSIVELEHNILSKNPHLKQIFSSIKKVVGPITISQISFEKKHPVENGILMIGDASGMIAPLCGNGMSMALHGSKIAFEEINKFLQSVQSRTEMEKNYVDRWNSIFNTRLKTGRLIQKFFGNPFLTNLLVSVLKLLPFLTRRVIQSTHGKVY